MSGPAMQLKPQPVAQAVQPQQIQNRNSSWSPIRDVLTMHGLAGKPDAELIAIAESALKSVHDQVEIIRASHGGESARVALCAPIEGHLDRAAAASNAIMDDERFKLTDSIERLALDMTHLNQALTFPSRLKWHREFAAAFDGERALRDTVKLPRLDRTNAYSGAVDPKAALEAVQQMKDDLKGEGHAQGLDIEVSDPQVAVGLIEANILDAYARQKDMMTRFQTAMAEDWPASTSLLEMLAGVVVDAVMAAATVGVGKWIGGVAGSLVKVAGFESVGLKAGHTLEEFFKGAAKKGLEQARSTNTKSVTARNAFVERIQNAVASSHDTAHRDLVKLAPALAQVDFAVLAELAQRLDKLPAAAAESLYHAAMVEWQNLKASLARPWPEQWSGHPHDPNLNAPNFGPYGDQPIAGVLEIGLDVHPDPELAYLVLRGAEPAAIAHFKEQKTRIGSVGLNRQYHLSFDGVRAEPDLWKVRHGTMPATFVKLGVGVHDGLQIGTIGPSELLTLKLYRAGRDQGWLSKLGASLGSVDHISDQDAIETAKALIRSADHITTENVERG